MPRTNLALALALDIGISVGFTGTQEGLNELQLEQIERSLVALFKGRGRSNFRHGDCIGADAQAAEIARKVGYELISHPPEDPKKRAFIKSHITLKPKPYLERNKDIVQGADILLVGPAQMVEQLRSGTWSTHRYGKKLRKQQIIFYPNGTTLPCPRP